MFTPRGRARSRLLAVLGLALVALLAGTPARASDDDGDPPLEILAFGDSLVHGYGLPEGQTFPDQLEQALRKAGEDVRVINAGSSGDTTQTGRSRLDWVLQEHVDAAIVVLGANDALRGIDPRVTHDNLDAILTRLDEKGVPTLLAGMKAPRNLGRDYVQAFDKVYDRLAAAHDVVFYPFFLEGVATKPELNQGDGIHPNAKGVAVIVENIMPKVKRLLARVRGQAESGG